MMEQRYCIYKLTCATNGKGYIGFTNRFKRRLREHKKTAAEGKGQAIHAAIRKYGWDSFVAEELYYSTDKQHTLDLEDYFINLYETKGVKGYNIIRGGQKGPPKGRMLTKEQLVRLREQNRDPENRRKISEALKGNHNGHGRLGRKVSDETKAKQSRAMIGNPGRQFSTEDRKQLSELMKGNLNAKGHTHTDEWKQKQSFYMKNRDHSYKKGKCHSPEHRVKIREAVIRHYQQKKALCQ